MIHWSARGAQKKNIEREERTASAGDSLPSAVDRWLFGAGLDPLSCVIMVSNLAGWRGQGNLPDQVSVFRFGPFAYATADPPSRNTPHGEFRAGRPGGVGHRRCLPVDVRQHDPLEPWRVVVMAVQASRMRRAAFRGARRPCGPGRGTCATGNRSTVNRSLPIVHSVQPMRPVQLDRSIGILAPTSRNRSAPTHPPDRVGQLRTRSHPRTFQTTTYQEEERRHELQEQRAVRRHA